MNNLICYPIQLVNHTFDVYFSKEIKEELIEMKAQAKFKLKELDAPLAFMNQTRQLSFIALTFFSAAGMCSFSSSSSSSSFQQKVIVNLWAFSLLAFFLSTLQNLHERAIEPEDHVLARSNLLTLIEKVSFLEKPCGERLARVEWAEFVQYIKEMNEEKNQVEKEEEKLFFLFSLDKQEKLNKLFSKIHVINALNRALYEIQNTNKLLAKIFWRQKNEKPQSPEQTIGNSVELSILKASKTYMNLTHVSPNHDLGHPLFNRLIKKLGGLNSEEFLNKVKPYLPSPDERVISKLSIKALLEGILFPTLFNQQETAFLFYKNKYKDIIFKFEHK